MVIRRYFAGESRIDLGADVQVRFGEIIPVSKDSWRSLLSALELERAGKLTHTAVHAGFVQTRVALRRFLGACLNEAPELIAIHVGDRGKPALAAHHQVHFNVAHTDKLFVLAAARFPVGVDVEKTDRFPENTSAILRRFFTNREADLYHALPEELRRAAFTRLWTCKEAVLKAIGVGLSGLEDFVIDLDPRVPPRILEPESIARTWQLTTFEPRAGYSAALATWSVLDAANTSNPP